MTFGESEYLLGGLGRTAILVLPRHRRPPVNIAYSAGSCSGDAPASDAQYPSYKIKEFPATTIVRLPYPRNTNARLRMTLQKFAWGACLFSRAHLRVQESNFCTSPARYGTREIALVSRRFGGTNGVRRRNRLFRDGEKNSLLQPVAAYCS